MKLALTGATGFVGRHVVAELMRRGMRPVLVLRPRAVAAPEWAGLETVRMDVADAPTDAFARLGRPDALIHLAWAGLPNYRSLHHFEQELPAHYRFLKALVEGGLRSLLVTGTCFEYGMQGGELDEGRVCDPDNPYGMAKDALRRQLGFLRQQHDFDLTWARLFYLFGDGQSPNALYSQLRRAVEQREPSFPMSGGEQLRDYLPIDRAAALLVALAERGGDAGIVNVCSGRPVSVRSLVERWIGDHGWPIVPALGHYAYPDYEPLAFWGSTRKLDRCLNPS